MKKSFKNLAKAVLRLIGLSDTMVLQIRHRDSLAAQVNLLKGKTNVVIFDVGGFDGRTTVLYRKKFPKAAIHIFEPFPKSCQSIRNKFGLDRSIRINEMALSDHSGKQQFHVNTSAATNSLLESNNIDPRIDSVTKTISTVEVEVMTVDQYCTEHHVEYIDILKMDVQGGELNVLRGAEKMLASHKIGMIFSELEFIEIYKGQPLEHDITLFLKKYGYTLFSMFNFSYLQDGQMSYCDGIYVHAK